MKSWVTTQTIVQDTKWKNIKDIGDHILKHNEDSPKFHLLINYEANHDC